MCGSAGSSGRIARCRAVLVTVTTRAAGARSSAGSRCAVNAQWPRWSTPSCISNPSTVVRCGIAITPALFMRMSTRSWPASTLSAAAATDERSPRSSGTTSSDAAGYRWTIRATAVVVFAGSRAARTTCAPAPASASADCRPSPPFAPVTTAVRPLRSGMSLLGPGQCTVLSTAASTSLTGTVVPSVPGRPRPRPGRVPATRRQAGARPATRRTPRGTTRPSAARSATGPGHGRRPCACSARRC